MLAQQTGSADDLAALSGLTESLQSIDWKNQYVWAYAWEAIEDMDVNLASEGNSYYDPGILKMFMTMYSYFSNYRQFQTNGLKRNLRIIPPAAVRKVLDCQVREQICQ